MTGGNWLIDVRRPGADRRLDVRIADGVVAQIVDHDEVDHDGVRYDAGGRWLVPGLYDGHAHLTQYAIQQSRIDLSTATSAAHAVDLVAAAAATAPQAGGSDSDEPLIGARFRDGLWPEPLHKDLLDRRFGRRPVIMISADLHCGWANSAGIALLGHPGHPTGVLKEEVWFEALMRLPQPSEQRTDALVEEVVGSAVRRGLVGLRDFEFADNLTVWERRQHFGRTPIRVDCAVLAPELSDATTRGLTSGQQLPGSDGLLTLGPVKVFVDGSLNTRTALCHDRYPGTDGHGETVLDHEALSEIMRQAQRRKLIMAVHAIGDLANTIALDCFERTGAGGSIEHAQLVADDDLGRYAVLGVTASMQPWHAIDDWQVADRYWAGRTGRAFPFAALVDAGAMIEFGSDAPVAPLDPWRAIAAAVDRESIIGHPWHPEQQLSVADALRFSTRGRGIVRAGQPADLVLLDADPYTLAAPELITVGVHATAVAGHWLHGPSALVDCLP
ncbi:amidohydrolase [Microlunatus soli]|uniref:Amidohydrolase 3 domain-containing protein n=1 Tax=Microlunatus soli TaxID=630515 RepID=A0A1H1Z5T2_9ACTN|nr:amidohydrolase family protein [Microlunatus soli]SDT29175.1 hypothetical protein SAMN04489812_5008 [Microlunatus soli]